jgi:hypothetical protein
MGVNWPYIIKISFNRYKKGPAMDKKPHFSSRGGVLVFFDPDL